LLGGLWIAEGTTNANLYYMVEIICVFTDTFDLRDNNEQLVKRDEKPLQPGNYFIVMVSLFSAFFASDQRA